MKKFLKILLVLFVLLVVTIGVALFVLTRPGVQKRIVESQLPEGSSIQTVRVTSSSLELSELKLALPDGTKVRLGMLDTEFKPLAALFNKTIKVGALNVSGLVVEVPQALIESPTPSTPLPEVPGDPSTPSGKVPAVQPGAAPSPEGSGSPVDVLYAIGQFEWLLDIDSIQLEGELRDGAGSTYSMDLRSGAIRPGQETTVEASLKLNSREALHAGLKNFDVSTRVFLKQNTGGGFEEVRMESLTKASDGNGTSLMTVSQELSLTVQGFDEVASLELSFNADLPKPEILLPGIVAVDSPINVQVTISAGAKGGELTLRETDLLLSLANAELASVKLNKQFTIGGNEDLSGNLMDVRLTDLPLILLKPWMPEGLALSGAPLSAQFNLTGLPGGALQLSSLAPLRIGPVSVHQDGQALLNEVTILAQPVVRMAADQSISWTLNDFQVQDRYGAMITGQSTGSFNASASSSGMLPAGLKTQTTLDIGLQEVTQQPALAAYTSILSGRALLDLKVDPADKYPLQVQGQLNGLSPRAYPGQRQDYRFALQLNEPGAGVLAVGANFEAGSENRPTSNLLFAGQVRAESSPQEFKMDLTSPRISQGDFELLRAAFEAQPQAATPVMPAPGVVTPPTPSTPKPSAGDSTPATPSVAAGPPWAGYDGALNVKVAELYLISGEVLTDLVAKVVVTEPKLSLNQLEASMNGGKIAGKGEMRFAEGQRKPYGIQTTLSFDNVDPSAFAKKDSGTFPVRGTFNGKADLAGQGATLEEAIDAIEGGILVTGREGVLTAFKLDDLLPSRLSGLGELGRIGIGLLGDQVNRPGITALAEAIPYFENMPFSDFTLRLNRSSDRRIVIPELRFVGRNLLINGTGSVAATSLKEAANQPLDLTLELGAKGKLVEYLQTLSLLGPNTTEDGFRRWNSAVKIKGSLSDPDSSALERILKEAANRALTQSTRKKEAPATTGDATTTGDAATTGDATTTPKAEGTEAPPVEQNLQKKPTKEEKILKDVETGLDALNSLFGG